MKNISYRQLFPRLFPLYIGKKEKGHTRLSTIFYILNTFLSSLSIHHICLYNYIFISLYTYMFSSILMYYYLTIALYLPILAYISNEIYMVRYLCVASAVHYLRHHYSIYEEVLLRPL